ncbi:MAG TPA: cupin domain-containing protein [Bacillota bacterium]|nr:cupin domain-containing protein [Bacillota bacterium]
MSEQLGERIKQLRLEKNLTLKEVAEKTGLSISFISQLEHDKTSATLESFKKISEALGVNPSYFFTTPHTDTPSTVVRGALEQADYEKNAFIYRDLKGAMENPLFNPILVVLHPGDNRGNNFTHKGQEFLYVLEGTLTVLLNEQKFTLEPNDCIFLDSSKPHYWQNHTDEPVKFLCVAATE